MKTLHRTIPAIFVTLLLMTATLVQAQDKVTLKEDITRKIVDSQQFVFHAQYVSPMNGRQRFLTPDYFVKITQDTLLSDLPYFGRTFSAPMNPSEGGIRFTSTKFDYKVLEDKKGGWRISIKPKDIQQVNMFDMTVFENGTATLQVNSTNRQPISFKGYISEPATKNGLGNK